MNTYSGNKQKKNTVADAMGGQEVKTREK